MPIFLFIVLHHYLSLFTQTFFHHRYSAHSMFTMSKAWEKVFFILSGVFQGSSYLSPYAYGVLHRMHHAYTDTEKDPHSPSYDKNLWAMMWRTKIEYSNIYNERVAVEEKFSKDLPKWTAFDRLADHWAVRLGWAGFYIAFYVVFATQWWMYLFLPLHFVMGPVHGAIINWFGHKYGTVNFKLNDTSKNLLPVDVVMLGEGYHNNHHKYPGRPNFGTRWHEIDPIYPVIRMLDLFKVIRLKAN